MVEKMDNGDSVLGTLSYLNAKSNKKSQQTTPELMESVKKPQAETNSLNVPKVFANKSVSAAEPYLKNFANMMSEEISNIKKAKAQEELERIRQEELEKIRAEQAAKLKLEEENERLKIEQEREKIRLQAEAEAEAQLLEERKRIREELLKEHNQTEPQSTHSEPSEYNPKDSEPEDLKESHECKKPKENQIEESLLVFSNGNKKKQIKEQTDFVTFSDLKNHYADFINKINHQLSTLGGGGEVLMSRLDDVDMATVTDGDFISYDAASGKFVGGSITPPGVEGGVIEGGEF